MQNNKVLDIIIILLECIKSKNRNLENNSGEYKIELKNCSYLLNQTIRQLILPFNHYFVSNKALKLWNQIRNDSILNYEYRNKIIKNTEDIVTIKKFKGSEKNPYNVVELKKGESFTYNDVFTDEHIVTVNNIIKALLKLDVINYKSVKEILDKLYICKILKEEDHLIKNKKNRSLDYKKVISEDYLDAGIILNETRGIVEEQLKEAQEELNRLEKQNY